MATLTGDEVARSLFGAVEIEKFNFARFIELCKEEYGELPKQGIDRSIDGCHCSGTPTFLSPPSPRQTS